MTYTHPLWTAQWLYFSCSYSLRSRVNSFWDSNLCAVFQWLNPSWETSLTGLRLLRGQLSTYFQVWKERAVVWSLRRNISFGTCSNPFLRTAPAPGRPTFSPKSQLLSRDQSSKDLWSTSRRGSHSGRKRSSFMKWGKGREPQFYRTENRTFSLFFNTMQHSRNYCFCWCHIATSNIEVSVGLE